jgi:hypothetical protein
MEPNFDIDNIFRETLGNATDVPPSSAWSHISNELPQGNPSVNVNTSGNWFTKLGLISKASIVVSGVALVSYVVLNMPSEMKDTQTVLNEKKAAETFNQNDQKQAPVEGTLNELDNVKKFDKQVPIINEMIAPEYSSELRDDYNYDYVGLDDPQMPNSNDVTVYNLDHSMSDKSNLLAEIAKSGCKHQLEISKFELTTSSEESIQFQIKGLNGLRNGKVSFGDKTIEALNADSDSTAVSHIYRVRNRKTFNVKVTAVGENGCKDSAQTKVEVIPTVTKQEEIIPTVFTPNGDGKNDEYFVTIAEPISYKMYIFDLRKNKIFYSENKDENWRGNCGLEPCANGIYEVILKLKYSGDEEMVITKRINLIRKAN